MIGTFITLFVAQLVFLTIAAYLNSCHEDREALFTCSAWFIYKELAARLPMMFVYSLSAIAVLFPFSRYVWKAHTIDSIRANIWAFLFESVLPYILIAIIVWAFLAGWYLVVYLTVGLLWGIIFHSLMAFWIQWSKELVASAIDHEKGKTKP